MSGVIDKVPDVSALVGEENILIGHRICPFVQRVAIVFDELSMPYKKVDIDLDRKPDWLKKYSPALKVPILLVGGEASIFESAIICEYLDSGTNKLFSMSSLKRAQEKSWISYSASILDVIAKIIYKSKDDVEIRRDSDDLREKILVVEKDLNEWPYFNKDFSMVDIMYAPIFRYFDFFKRFLGVDFYGGNEKLEAWSSHVLARPSVMNCVSKSYDKEFKEFILGKNKYLYKKLN